ncbi:hypothetical protein [Streptomyces sp. NPDC047079]|uniref:hypothetical protein n=1 Tax=Streptomyces sp. NPDC047079 TaxID=3154607 RepID=UPI0033F4C784
MRVSRFAAALGVAAAVLLGGATGASAATYAPSVVSHATHDRDHDHDDYGRGDREGRWGHHRGGNHGWGDHRWGDHRWGDHRWGDRRWGGHGWGDRHDWSHGRDGHR